MQETTANSAVTRRRQRLAAAAAGALVAGACATNRDGSFKVDDKATGAILGAVAGCGVAAATGGDCAKGAVVGAIAGFLISWYFESKKLADAKQVNTEYETGKKYQVPRNEVKPVAFSSNVKAAPPDTKGEREVRVTSNTDLVGYGDKVPKMQQKYAIYDEKNKLVETKTENIAAVDGAGRYQTNAKFKTPANAKGKTYRVETTLLADNKEVKKNSYSISFLDDDKLMVAALF